MSRNGCSPAMWYIEGCSVLPVAGSLILRAEIGPCQLGSTPCQLFVRGFLAHRVFQSWSAVLRSTI